MGTAETGIFTFGTANLGDEMQSFAVLAHLDRVDAFLDRDHLADVDAAGEIACVFNSWFLVGNDFRPPAACVKPIWHGFAGWEEIVRSDWLAYLKAQGPIGCRDWFVTRLLAEAGVETRWTGCLTLFLGRAMSFVAPRREGVVFVDVPTEVERYLPPEITQRAIRLSTFPDPDTQGNPLARWAAVGRLAEALATAELVVTRRLHAALPAASFGTPVVAVPDPGISQARRRFAGFESIIPTVYTDEAAQGLGRLDWGHLPKARIPAELEQAYAAFTATLQRRGMVERPGREATALDQPRRLSQTVTNATGLQRPGQVRLRLASRTFAVPVLFWSDRFVELGLQGFPGLSKFGFHVEVRAVGSEAWVPWGSLRELLI